MMTNERLIRLKIIRMMKLVVSASLIKGNPVKPKEAVETPGSVKEVYECITDMAKSDGSKIDRLQ